MKKHIVHIETPVSGCMDCPAFQNINYPRIKDDMYSFYYYTKCMANGKVLVNKEVADIIGDAKYVNHERFPNLPEEYFLPDKVHNIFRKGKPGFLKPEFNERGSEVLILNTIDIDCPLEDVEEIKDQK